MFIKRMVLVLVVCVMGSVESIFAKKWSFENMTNNDVTIKISYKYTHSRTNHKEDSVIVPQGSFGFFNAPVSSNYSDFKITAHHTDGTVLGQDVANHNEHKGWKIRKSSIEEDNWIKANKHTFKIVNKTNLNLGLNVIMSAGCGNETMTLAPGGQGHASCSSLLEGVKGIMCNGTSNFGNLFNVLPWNGDIKEDAVFYIRKMTTDEQTNYSSIFTNTMYQQANYMIELHKVFG